MGKGGTIGEWTKMLRKLIKSMFPFFCFYLLLLNFYGFHQLRSLQGDARVINYAGLVRGMTQRLVKLELAGEPRNAMIEELDDILAGLRGDVNDLNLTYMADPTFQKSLRLLDERWSELKDAIQANRRDPGRAAEVLQCSEKHFIRANETVGYAEAYSALKIASLENARYAFYTCTAFFLAMLFAEALHVTLLQRKNGRLDFLAYTDKKTGLPNRARCDQMLESYAAGPLPEPFVCVMIDLDGLKATNDAGGHAAGDEFIRVFGLMLARAAIPYGFVGRWGGDEFIALFDQADVAAARAFIASLERSAAQYGEHALSFSYGIATHTAQSPRKQTIYSLLEQADAVMYEQKRAKKGAHP